MSESPHQTNDKVLVLMRGLPSSGKSYRAMELSGGDDSIIFSADKFWGKTKEEYLANWKREKLFLAHGWCQNNVKDAIAAGKPLIIVDNTNTQLREMKPYYDMAVEGGYRVEIHEPTSPWWLNDIAPYLHDKVKYKSNLEEAVKLLYEKNKETHGVPLETMQAMMDRYQPGITVESFWKE